MSIISYVTNKYIKMFCTYIFIVVNPIDILNNNKYILNFDDIQI